MAKRSKHKSKHKWRVDVLSYPACPPFCESLSEDNQYDLLQEDIEKYYTYAKNFKQLLQLNIDFLRGERAIPGRHAAKPGHLLDQIINGLKGCKGDPYKL